jgi:hypothetical protein
MENEPPSFWADSYRVYEDGSMECVCYWCNEPMLFFPEDSVAVVATSLREFAGVQCQKCLVKYAGRNAPYPCRRNSNS